MVHVGVLIEAHLYEQQKYMWIISYIIGMLTACSHNVLGLCDPADSYSCHIATGT